VQEDGGKYPTTSQESTNKQTVKNTLIFILSKRFPAVSLGCVLPGGSSEENGIDLLRWLSW
jgi:hypothetical protein